MTELTPTLTTDWPTNEKNLFTLFQKDHFVTILIFKVAIGGMKTKWVIFFEIKLLLQPDVVFDSESNGRNFSSLSPPGGEKKYFHFFTKLRHVSLVI